MVLVIHFTLSLQPQLVWYSRDWYIATDGCIPLAVVISMALRLNKTGSEPSINSNGELTSVSIIINLYIV